MVQLLCPSPDRFPIAMIAFLPGSEQDANAEFQPVGEGWNPSDIERAREEAFADRLYERRWALAVLEQVLMRLESEYQAAGNAALFERLKEFLVG